MNSTGKVALVITMAVWIGFLMQKSITRLLHLIGQYFQFTNLDEITLLKILPVGLAIFFSGLVIYNLAKSKVLFISAIKYFPITFACYFVSIADLTITTVFTKACVILILMSIASLLLIALEYTLSNETKEEKEEERLPEAPTVASYCR